MQLVATLSLSQRRSYVGVDDGADAVEQRQGWFVVVVKLVAQDDFDILETPLPFLSQQSRCADVLFAEARLEFFQHVRYYKLEFDGAAA